MLTFVPLLGLVVFVLVRPLELFPAWQGIPLLPFLVAASVGGLLLDASGGHIKARAIPHVTLALGWMGWAVLAAIGSSTATMSEVLGTVWLPAALFVLLAIGIDGWQRLERAAAVVVCCSLWIGVVCLEQTTRPWECVALLNPADPNSDARPDGRPCEQAEECNRDPPLPDASYRCERAGMFDATTVDGGRIRYVGVLHDPNEVALALSLAVPLALALHRRRPSLLRLVLLASTLLVAATVVIASRSRGGMIVLASLPIVHAIAEKRVRVAVLGLGLAAPVLLLGGRSGERASASTLERLDTWQEGLHMLRDHPLLGVGTGQFTRHHPLTAHNSFLLAASEQGFVGLLLWCALVLAALEWLPVTRTLPDPTDTRHRIWTTALKTSLAGLVLGSMFLSLNRHVVTWLHFGLGAAAWRCRQIHSPTAHSTPSGGDLLRSAILGALVLSAIGVAVRASW